MTRVTIDIPTETRRALGVRAAETGSTVRAVVLGALAEAGVYVPPDESGDRRAKPGQKKAPTE